MSEIVKLGEILTAPVKKLGNAINKIPNTDEGTHNAIKIVAEEQKLTDEVMREYMNKQLGQMDNKLEKNNAQRPMFDGTGNAARTVNKRLNEEPLR